VLLGARTRDRYCRPEVSVRGAGTLRRSERGPSGLAPQAP